MKYVTASVRISVPNFVLLPPHEIREGQSDITCIFGEIVILEIPTMAVM
jgi:hypothetical protein